MEEAEGDGVLLSVEPHRSDLSLCTLTLLHRPTVLNVVDH